MNTCQNLVRLVDPLIATFTILDSNLGWGQELVARIDKLDAAAVAKKNHKQTLGKLGEPGRAESKGFHHTSRL